MPDSVDETINVRTGRNLLAAWVAAALALMASAGCANSRSGTYENTDSRSFAESAMSTSPLLVKIQGRPYAAPEQQIEDAVLDAMRQAMSWTATPRLTTDPAAAKIPSMAVIVTFNDTVDADAQCSGGGEGGEPQPRGAVQVTASFCGDQSPISTNTRRISESTGVGDPQFATLISQVTGDLFAEDYRRPVAPGMYIGGGSGGFGLGGGIGIGIGIGGW